MGVGKYRSASAKASRHVVEDWPLLALLGVLGAVQDVRLGGFEFPRGLQGELDGVLDNLDRGLARPRGHDVDDAQGQLGDRGVRGAVEGSEAAVEGALDAHGIERHDAAIALDNGGRQRNFLDAVEDAEASRGEIEVELSDTVGVRGVGVRSVHRCTYQNFRCSAAPQQAGLRGGDLQHVVVEEWVSTLSWVLLCVSTGTRVCDVVACQGVLTVL